MFENGSKMIITIRFEPFSNYFFAHFSYLRNNFATKSSPNMKHLIKILFFSMMLVLFPTTVTAQASPQIGGTPTMSPNFIQARFIVFQNVLAQSEGFG